MPLFLCAQSLTFSIRLLFRGARSSFFLYDCREVELRSRPIDEGSKQRTEKKEQIKYRRSPAHLIAPNTARYVIRTHTHESILFCLQVLIHEIQLVRTKTTFFPLSGIVVCFSSFAIKSLLKWARTSTTMLSSLPSSLEVSLNRSSRSCFLNSRRVSPSTLLRVRRVPLSQLIENDRCIRSNTHRHT